MLFYTDPSSEKADALIAIEGVKIGLQVVRGVAYPFEDPITQQRAQTILENRLNDIISSSASVALDDSWQKQILIVLTTTQANRETFELAYEAINSDLHGDTIVWLIHTTSSDGFIYSGDDPVCNGSAVGDELLEVRNLQQNFPNPFNPRTTIGFDVPREVEACLRVYDVSGRLVDVLLNGVTMQGHYEVVWRGRDMAGRVAPAGVYFYRLEAEGYVETKRMTLMK